MSTTVLLSNEGIPFSVSENVVSLMTTIDNVVKNFGESDEPVPISNVNTETLKLVIEYAQKYLDNPFNEEESTSPKHRTMEPWELEFFSGSWTHVKNVMLAANYLEFQVLLKASGQYIASKIIQMTPDEIKEYCSK